MSELSFELAFELAFFIDLLFSYGVSNSMVVLPLALLAWCIQLNRKWVSLANLLWVLVLIKLITPPLVSMPLFSIDQTELPLLTVYTESIGSYQTLFDWKLLVAALWLFGSLLITAHLLFYITRFNRLLNITSVIAENDIQTSAQKIGMDLGLKTIPSIFITSANISPMVWWVGGNIRVYLPATLTAQMDKSSLSLILAHELAHIRFSDHIVRMLELLVRIICWWNPVAWWARFNLRRTEELRCDAFVISKLGLDNRQYARTLLSTLEILSKPAMQVPAMASGINSGGFMEKRIKMIVSNKFFVLTPRRLRIFILLGSLFLLPMGISTAQNLDDLESVKSWLQSSVESAQISQEQSDVMLEALQNNFVSESDIRQEALQAMKLKYSELQYSELQTVFQNQEGTGMTREETREMLSELEEQLSALNETQFEQNEGR